MSFWLWAMFVAFLLLMLAVDLRLLRPGRHEIVSVRKALAWSGAWTLLALLFNVLVYFIYEWAWLDKGTRLDGERAVWEFLTAYLIERSLSIDNLLVFAIVFERFDIPLRAQMRVLDWAVVGAFAMRAVMITAGVMLIDHFAWFSYIFAAMLLLTAGRMLFTRPDRTDYRKSAAVRAIRKRARLTGELAGDRFAVRHDAKRRVTPLLLALVAIESANLVFAADSIPAAISVTQDPFLVFTSNAFAVLGLRSLYFALLGTIQKIRFIKVSLAAILLWVAVKTLIHGVVEVPAGVSLTVVVTLLMLGVMASLLFPSTQHGPWVPPVPPELASVAEITWAAAKRLVVFVLGASVLLVGVSMIVLPGPAVIVIPLGLGILATEFVWAQRLLRRARKSMKGAMTTARSRRPRWLTLPRFMRRESP